MRLHMASVFQDFVLHTTHCSTLVILRHKLLSFIIMLSLWFRIETQHAITASEQNIWHCGDTFKPGEYYKKVLSLSKMGSKKKNLYSVIWSSTDSREYNY